LGGGGNAGEGDTSDEDAVSEASGGGGDGARGQLEDLKDIVAVMVRGLRACDAAQMALRQEVASQKASLAKVKNLAALRADLESKHSQLQARVTSLERKLAAHGQSGRPAAGRPGPERPAASAAPSAGRAAPHAGVHITAAQPGRRRHVRFAAPPAGEEDNVAVAMSGEGDVGAPIPPVDDADITGDTGSPSLPSYATLRATTAPSLPPELRLAGDMRSSLMLGAPAWRFATAVPGLGSAEPPRPAATAPMPLNAGGGGVSPRYMAYAPYRPVVPPGSVSLYQHAGLA
jgi:hypothetical protein